MSARRLRCAIYTRKSSEEGLDQAFNSLDAQREACAAYILSQAGEGWSAVKAAYDDGGFSARFQQPASWKLPIDHPGRERLYLRNDRHDTYATRTFGGFRPRYQARARRFGATHRPDEFAD